jgi:glycosyltransferase involved in cell wall biosynthesis
MASSIETMSVNQSVKPAQTGYDSRHPSSETPTVVIVGPPWPRSGATRVIRNQIDYYRARQFQTVLVVVPFHKAFMRSSPVWKEIVEGMRELGADRSFTAPLEPNRYKAAKYTSSIRHAFRGTGLDWAYAMGDSVQLPENLMEFLRFAHVTLLHVNYVQTLGFALRLRKRFQHRSSRIPIILETHDVQSHLLQEIGELNPWTHKPDLPERTVHSEISLLQQADALVHLSADDFCFFKTKMPDKPHVLAMPAFDEAYISAVNAAAPVQDTIDLLFAGQNHGPNLAALKWFFEEVWPLLAKNNYNLKIVGRVDSLVRESSPQLFEAFRSCFVGPVSDLAPYYSSARCVIAPMVSGSGTSIKTIEALALGKPFVGTSKAFRGMSTEQIKANGILSYDTPRTFADAVVNTLADGKNASERSRAAYNAVFSVQVNFASRDEAVRAAIAAKR